MEARNGSGSGSGSVGDWPALSGAVRHLLVAPEVAVEPLARAEIDQLTTALGTWYPALAVGEEAALLSRDYYLSEVALAGEAATIAQRVVLVVVVKQAGELSACLVLEAMECGRVLAGRMTVVSPRAYGKRLGVLCAQIVVAVAAAIGAERAYALAELDNHASRKALEGAGFVLTGILPASDRKPQPDGSVKYVAEGIYVHSLVPAERWVWPSACELTPRCAALLQLLFPRDGNESALPITTRSRLLRSAVGIDDLSIRPLRRDELAAHCQRLVALCPTLVDSCRECFLLPSFYEQQTAFAGEIPDLDKRPLQVWIVERAGEFVGCCVVSYVAKLSLLDIRVCAVSPGASHEAFVATLFKNLLLVAQTSGARLIQASTSLRNHQAQKCYESMGLDLLALVPAADRHHHQTNPVYGLDALYGLSLVPDEQCCLPPLAPLPPRLRALTEFMYARAPGSIPGQTANSSGLPS